MKRLLIAFWGACIIVGIYSCQKDKNLLDPTVTTDLNEQSVFSDSSRTMDYLFAIYSQISFDFEYYRYAKVRSGTSDICDESMNRYYTNSAFAPIVNGTLSAANDYCYANDWKIPYKQIRAANLFISKVGDAPISEGLKKQSTGEARVLRDWFYFTLMRYFGGVPILKDTVFGISDDFTKIPRASYADCVDYLVNDLDLAAADLPVQYDAQNYGRITKGTALALKARVLLYAASPLYNGGNIGKTAEQTQVCGYASYDENRWQLAAQAAKAVIDLGVYHLMEDNTTAPGYGFEKVFLTRVNPEYIFGFMQGPEKNIENYLFAPSRQGLGYSAPTENLAEAFGMNNGKPIDDPSSGYNAQDPYSNRDPRFNYTLAHNGTLWINPSDKKIEPIWTYDGASLDGYGARDYFSGYFYRKMMDSSISWGISTNTERCLPLIRYADILLMYGEASNEIGNTNIAYQEVEQVRERAGIQPGADGLYGLKPNMSKDEMREVIQNERQVEFVYEDQRFWDLRRWKIADKVLNRLQLMAMKITKQDDGTFSYEKVPMTVANSKLVFQERNYFFPISQTELGRDPALIQNPGY